MEAINNKEIVALLKSRSEIDAKIDKIRKACNHNFLTTTKVVPSHAAEYAVDYVTRKECINCGYVEVLYN